MEENYKLKALTKLLTKLVIPTVNKLTDETGLEINSIEAVKEHIFDYDKWYEIKVEVSFHKEITRMDLMFSGISNLILNSYVYIADDQHILSIKFDSFKTKNRLDSWNMLLWGGDRISDSEAIERIKKGYDGQ